jgi:MYXO-CTERM domain-containing protein
MTNFCLFTCSSSQTSAGEAFGALALAGLGVAAVGLPLVIIGGRHVTRVTASVGPAGGALRVTF